MQKQEHSTAVPTLPDIPYTIQINEYLELLSGKAVYAMTTDFWSASQKTDQESKRCIVACKLSLIKSMRDANIDPVLIILLSPDYPFKILRWQIYEPNSDYLNTIICTARLSTSENAIIQKLFNADTFWHNKYLLNPEITIDADMITILKNI